MSLEPQAVEPTVQTGGPHGTLAESVMLSQYGAGNSSFPAKIWSKRSSWRLFSLVTKKQKTVTQGLSSRKEVRLFPSA